MKKLLSLVLVMCMAIGCVPILAEEATEEYYIDVEFKKDYGNSLSYDITVHTNCPEFYEEIYYPDGTQRGKTRKFPGNFYENGAYCDNSNYYDYDGEYTFVFYYEDCRTEVIYTVENSDQYKAWWVRTYGYTPEPKEPETTAESANEKTPLKVNIIEVSENDIELYPYDVKDVTVKCNKTVTVEVENEDVVEAKLSNGVLSVKALKAGTSEIWLRTSETYTSVRITVIYGENPDKKYSDIEKDSVYAEAVQTLSNMGIMDGYGDNTFRPDKFLTRAEAATVMIRLLNLDENIRQGKTIFSDVESTHWASGYINEALKWGIIHGKGDGSFAPNEYVTYEQMVKMLVCALGYEPVAVANGGWNGGGYILTASKIGLTTSITGTKTGQLTRGKTAQMVFGRLALN